ncbi:3'-5' exonuclease [Rhodoferax sp.]|uniref:3'-5' exonuclease n=1 Tax=Rhodoferax sp. TaxID=50421 RepID=UPI0025EE5C02|nr:3'-5' exonuclease [Rhodoferax sp.]
MPSSPAKQPRTRKSPAADPQQQLSLLFNEAPETVTAPAPAPAVAAVAVVLAPPADNAEALALQLEQHPDYRVLRRLVPQREFAAAPAQGVKRLLVLDTETTGLEHSRDKIIELALLRVDIDTATGLACGSVQVYDGLEDPGQPIPDIARKITGIDDSMVAGQALDEARIAELLEGVDLVVAHNAGFDRPFVEARLPAFAAKAWACSFADIDWKKQGRDSAKLTALALDLGLFYDAHRAEMDCHALLAVLQAPLPVAGHTGLAHLLTAAEGTRYRLQATGAAFDAKDALKERGYRWDAANKVWHTWLSDEASLQLECDWLATEVYRGRAAKVQVEALDARVRYANRAGVLSWKNLG